MRGKLIAIPNVLHVSESCGSVIFAVCFTFFSFLIFVRPEVLKLYTSWISAIKLAFGVGVRTSLR